jgi:alpha-tubulin suppressor-like RCC1 family protein
MSSSSAAAVGSNSNKKRKQHEVDHVLDDEDVDDDDDEIPSEAKLQRLIEDDADALYGGEGFAPFVVKPPTKEQVAFRKRCQASFELNAEEILDVMADVVRNDPPSDDTDPAEGIEAAKYVPACLEFNRLMMVNSYRYETDDRVGWIMGCGDNESGSLGVHLPGTRQNATTGIRLLNPNLFDAQIRQISCGAMTSAALSVNGVVYTFGPSDQGTLGRTFPPHLNSDHAYLWEATPAPLDDAPPGIRQVACGNLLGLCLTENGLVYAWGCYEDNNNQRFKTTSAGGNDDPAGWNDTPVHVPGLSNILHVYTGPEANFCYALALDGTLYSWGEFLSCAHVVVVHSLVVASFIDLTCLLLVLVARPVLSFPLNKQGFGNCGELGRISLNDPKSHKPSADFGLYSFEKDGEKCIDRSVLKEFLLPKPVPLPSKKVVSVACGATFAVIVARNDQNFGIAYSAGNNGFGQLGNGRASKEDNQLDLRPVRSTHASGRADVSSAVRDRGPLKRFFFSLPNGAL